MQSKKQFLSQTKVLYDTKCDYLKESRHSIRAFDCLAVCENPCWSEWRKLSEELSMPYTKPNHTNTEMKIVPVSKDVKMHKCIFVP